MANSYLDAYRSSNGGGTTLEAGSGNSRLKSYRASAPEREEEDRKKREQERQKAAQQLAAETKRKQEEEKNKPWYQKGLEGVVKGFSAPELGKVAKNTGDFVKSVTVDPAVTLYKQANIGAANNQGVSPEEVKNQAKFLDSQVKEGKITQQEADKRKAKNQQQADINIKAVQAEEKKQGVKRDQDAGVGALLDTIGNLSGVGAIAKGGAKLAGEVAEKALDTPVGMRFAEGAKNELKKFQPPRPELSKKEANVDLMPGIEKGQFKGTSVDPLKVPVESLGAGAEQVGIRTPIKPGIRQESTTYKVTPRAPKAMTDEDYTKRFNSLSKAYEKESKALESKGPLAQENTANAIDAKYSKLIDDLDYEYQHGVMPKQTLISRMSRKTSKAEKTTGGAPTSGINAKTPEVAPKTRANKYLPSEKQRITKQEATQKLKSAGYTTDESLAILEDALPEKGLSMPGSPKNIKLNDASIQKAAADFDEIDTPSAPIEQLTTSLAEVPVEAGTTLKPLVSIDGTAEQGISKLGQSTRDSAVYDKIIKKTEAETEGLLTYNKANMQQQADYATGLIKANPQEAIDIAMGRKAAPEHVLQQMVYNAVEDHATKIGGDQGGKLLLELSKSRQSTNLTKMGQEIRAAAERDPHSPVTMMDEVKLARAEAAKKRGKDISKAAREDAAVVKKATPKISKETWDSFIKGLDC